MFSRSLSKITSTAIYRTVIALVLDGCETWSLILREEHRLMVFENRVLRRIFGPKMEKVAGGWRRSMQGGDMKCIHNFGRKT
jgi:hypothetical protein